MSPRSVVWGLCGINQFNLKKDKEQSQKNSHTVLVIGESNTTKKNTVKGFSKTIDQFGTLSDFNSARKNTLNFFIETTAEKLLPMIKQLEESKCLLHPRVTDYRTVIRSSSLPLHLLITVNLN